MGQIDLPGSPAISVRLRRSARARRLSLRVSRLDGQVTLTLPRRASLREAEGFAREKEHWIRRNLADRPAQIRPSIGGSILFEGREVPIVACAGRAARYADGALMVPAAPDRVATRVAAFLKLAARARLNDATDRYAAALGRDYGRMTLRDTRSRWGSCSTEGNLMYSWRLVMAPAEVLGYVAAHEVAHLAEMNHSPAYWRVVAGLYPSYEAPRRWLRQNGEMLHRYVFGD